MGDLIIPFVPNEDQDPLDSPFLENALRYFEENNPTFDFEYDTQWVPESGQEFLNPLNHEEDPLFWDNNIMMQDPNVDHPDNVVNMGYEDEINIIPLSVWPPAPSPFSCSHCQVLREIIHVNGTHTTKFEIHGRIGIICHAILETRYNVVVDGDSSVNHQMIEIESWKTRVRLNVSIRRVLEFLADISWCLSFSMQSMESVKQFLIQYCQDRNVLVPTFRIESWKTRVRLNVSIRRVLEFLADISWCLSFSMQSMESVKQLLIQYCQDRKQEGFVILQDPLSTFYDAICAGLNWSSTDEFTQPPKTPSENTEACQTNHSQAETNVVRVHKSGLAKQRQRTRKLKLSDLSVHFHLTINSAAKKLGLCPTVLKKICRRNGMKRWPYRKVTSINRKISKLQRSLREKDGEGSACVHADIKILREELAKVCSGKADK